MHIAQADGANDAAGAIEAAACVRRGGKGIAWAGKPARRIGPGRAAGAKGRERVQTGESAEAAGRENHARPGDSAVQRFGG
jgi:hypothetical protein